MTTEVHGKDTSDTALEKTTAATESSRNVYVRDEFWRRHVPRRFRGVVPEKIHPGFREAVAESIASLETEAPKGLLLTGDVGKGKTATLWLVARTVVTHLCKPAHLLTATVPPWEPPWDGHCLFVGQFELVRQLRDHYGGSEGEAGQYPPCFWRQYLFIDDLGTSFDDRRGWNLGLLQQLVNYRWENCLPTYVSTNYSLQELAELEGWRRITDRLLDRSWIIRAAAVSGGSMRDSK